MNLLGVTLTIDGVEKTDGYVLESSDESIAKIENNRVVAGEKEGTVTITAYFDEYDMTIGTDVFTYIAINTINAKLSSSTIKVGQEASLTVSVLPKNGTDEFINYSSNDKSIATVNDEGVITGVSKGTAIITIMDDLTGASTTKTITVK